MSVTAVLLRIWMEMEIPLRSGLKALLATFCQITCLHLVHVQYLYKDVLKVDRITTWYRIFPESTV